MFTHDAEMCFIIAMQVNIGQMFHMKHDEKSSAHALLKSLQLKSTNNSLKLYERAVVNYRNHLLVAHKVDFSHPILMSGRLNSVFVVESSMEWAIEEA